MMGQKVFAESVAEKIKDYLPPEYDNVKCTVSKQSTNNGSTKVYVCFKREGQDMAPLLLVEPFYEDVRNGKPLDEVMQNIASHVQQDIGKDVPNVSKIIGDYNKIKDHIGLRLINTKANQKMLAALPHQKIEDLSLIPVIRLLSTKGNYVTKITNQLMESWGVNCETIFEKAMENMGKVQPPVLLNAQCVVPSMEEMNLLEAGIETEIMYVLTNRDGIDGASSIVCPGVMEKMCDMFPEGYYILPCSVHEMLIFPKRNYDIPPQELGRMVRDVNRKLCKEDFLSDRVYEYNKEKGKIQQIPESIDRNKEWER